MTTTTTKTTEGRQAGGPGVTVTTVTEKVIDSYYLHICNSGIHINSLEKTYTSASHGYTGDYADLNGDTDSPYKSWRIEYSLGAFSSDVKTTFNLQTVEQCDVLINVISKVKAKILEHYGPTGKDQHDSLSPSRPTIIDGYKTEEVYGPVEGDDKNGGKDLLGYNLLDDNNTIVGFIKNEVEGRGRYWGSEDSCSDGSDITDGDTGEEPLTKKDINLLKDEGKISQAEAEFLIGLIDWTNRRPKE